MTACDASWMAVSYCSSLVAAMPSGMPCTLNTRASITSGHVTKSRPWRMATISASFTMSLIMAPDAYGDMSARLSTCSGVSTLRTLAR